MSYSLNSFKEGYMGDYIGDYYGVIKGDTRSLDYSSYDKDHTHGMSRFQKAAFENQCSRHVYRAWSLSIINDPAPEYHRT